MMECNMNKMRTGERLDRGIHLQWQETKNMRIGTSDVQRNADSDQDSAG